MHPRKSLGFRGSKWHTWVAGFKDQGEVDDFILGRREAGGFHIEDNDGAMSERLEQGVERIAIVAGAELAGDFGAEDAGAGAVEDLDAAWLGGGALGEGLRVPFSERNHIHPRQSEKILHCGNGIYCTHTNCCEPIGMACPA
jgi:hypothetical protein